MSDPDDLVRRPPTPAEEFPAVHLGDWRAAAERSLDGGNLADLDIEIGGGVVVRPLYTGDDAPDSSGFPGLAPFVRGGGAISGAVAGWQPCLRCDHPDPVVSARWIAAAAARGIDSIWLVTDAAVRLGIGNEAVPARPPDGVVISTLAGLDPLLDAMGAPSAAIRLDGGGSGIAVAAAVVAAWRGRGGRPDGLAGSLGWDPLGALAADGRLACGLDRSLELLADVAAWAERSGSGLTAVTVSTLPYVSAGADAVAELASAAATGVEYLRSMAASGLGLEVACRRLDFRVTIGLDLFSEIAKLRALRRIWSRVVEVCGGDESIRRAPVHAVTSPSWLTRRDPWVNMLRGTTAAFAAVAGGAELVTVLPFDAAIGPSDELAHRIAANLHTILREESQLGRVLDPGGGSYLVERLTADLAEAAWSRFQDIERAGGMAAVLVDGSLARSLAESARARAGEIASRRHPITGVTWFADLNEAPVERPPVAREDVAAGVRQRATRPTRQLDELRQAVESARSDGSVLESAVAAVEAGASIREVAEALRGAERATEIEPLPARRDSERFESLRDASDALAVRTGARPRAFLVAAGTPSGMRSCLDLARGVLAAGGIETVGGAALGEADEPTQAFAASGAQIACICVADGHDAVRLAALAATLRAAGARSVAAVAASGTSTPGCRKAGVDHLLREGDNVIDALASLLAACGAADG